MNQQERARVGQLISALERFAVPGHPMTLNQVLAFLHIAHQPGISITELATKSRTYIQSSSRDAKALRKIGGTGLVAVGFGKDDRTKAALLTDTGRALVRNILVSLEGGKVSAQGSPRDHQAAA